MLKRISDITNNIWAARFLYLVLSVVAYINIGAYYWAAGLTVPFSWWIFFPFLVCAKLFIAVASPLLHGLLALGGSWLLFAGYVVTVGALLAGGFLMSEFKNSTLKTPVINLVMSVLSVLTAATAAVIFTPASIVTAVFSLPVLFTIAAPIALTTCVAYNALPSVFLTPKSEAIPPSKKKTPLSQEEGNSNSEQLGDTATI